VTQKETDLGVKELGHIVLYVRNLERSAAFYRDVLGWEAIGSTRPGGGAAAFRSESHRTHHELLLIEVGEEAPLPPRGRRAGLYHFGLKVGTTDDELRAALKKLEENNVRIVGSSDHTVTHSLYILDPDGNEIELYIDVQPEVWRDEPSAVLTPVKPLRL
jgi:catechol 2,3-dioxygenase